MSQRQGRGRPPGLSAVTDDFCILSKSLTDRTIKALGTRAVYTRVDREAIQSLIDLQRMAFGYADRVRREMAPMQPAAIPVEKKRKRVPGMEGLN